MTETLSVVMERQIPHPPEKIWRALTQPQLIAEWLMDTDFQPDIGHRFNFKAEWGSVDCQVLEVEPHRSLSYSWGDTRLKSVVTWTLTPAGTGTHLRMEQAGFQPDQPRYFEGARMGWPKFLDNLDRVLGQMEQEPKRVDSLEGTE